MRKNSTFASNYSYLSCKYNLSHHDWHLDTSHLIGKVRLKNKQKSCHIGSCQDIIELCDIRDGLALWNIIVLLKMQCGGGNFIINLSMVQYIIT